MGKTLRFLSSISFVCLFLATLSGHVVAQTILNPGDIILVSVNSDSPDNFDVIPLVDLQAGTIIHFTDNAYITANSSLEDNEGTLTYTAAGAISAGTVLSYSGSDKNGFTQTQGNFSASSSGDNIIIFQSTATDTTFLYGAGWARGSSVWNYSAVSSTNRSDIPPPLSFADSTIISLGTDDNYQYDFTKGTEGGKISLFNLAGDESNWKADDANAFTAFSAAFTVYPPPIIQFSASTDNVAEDAGTYAITVKLAEAGSPATEVKASVAFLSGSSSASASDISNYSTETVTFASGASTGDTQTVNITIADNSTFDGRKTAVFQLQNNTAGSIVEPDILNLSITDDESPPVVINEFLADPASGPSGDANRDETRDGDEDEFIEIVNNSSIAIDISGWKLSDDGTANSSSITHIFPSGTVLPGNGAAVVFGGGNPAGSFGGAIVQISSVGSVSLTNTHGHVTLLNDQNNIIQDIIYSSTAGDDQSLTRYPYVTGSNFIKHSTATGSGGALFSPGTKVDGTAFGSTYAIGIRGQEGWRFIATPSQNTSFDDLFSSIWTQGIPGSDAPTSTDANIYSWSESGGGSFSVIGDLSNTMTAGQGYITYVYQDDNFRKPGTQGGFPKVLKTNNAENTSPVSVAVSSEDGNSNGNYDSATNEGYNLLGNPYGTDISVSAVINALAAVNPNVNANVYIWDPNGGSGNGAYKTISSGSIAPFQAFFVRYTALFSSKTATFTRNDLAANIGNQFYGKAGESPKPPITFNMHLGNGHKFDTYQVKFDENGSAGEDRWDAYKLFSLNVDPVSLYSTLGDGVKIAKNVLPELGSLKRELKIPLGYNVPVIGKYTFSWSTLDKIPQKVDVYLMDHKTGKRIDMKTQDKYQFTIAGAEQAKAAITKKALSPLLTKVNDSNSISSDEDTPRFELSVVPTASKQQQEEPLQKDVVLSPNYPNPFSSQTTMKLQLKETMHVTMTVYNIVGQKVATMYDGMIKKGESQPMTWNVPANMPSGVYICRVQAGGQIITRKMTLIK